MRHYFYLKLKDLGYNIKTNPILTNYLTNFTEINIDEDKCISPDIISKQLEKYDKKENVIVFYQHKSMSLFKDNLTNYLNNKKTVNFTFYLFTFDFWYSRSRKQFQPKNFKVFTFAYNIEQLEYYLKSNLNVAQYKRFNLYDLDELVVYNKIPREWEKNFIFKNFWCCYKESILDINLNPIYKLLISGAIHSAYPERVILNNLSKTNKHIIILKKDENDIKSKEFTYNKKLNSYFACFSSSVHLKGKNTHLIVLKTFEILGSGALLVMPKEEEKFISTIGLIHLKNCVLLDFTKDVNNQINWIFESKNQELLNKIRKEGQTHAKKNLNENKMINEIKCIIEK